MRTFTQYHLLLEKNNENIIQVYIRLDKSSRYKKCLQYTYIFYLNQNVLFKFSYTTLPN